MHEMTVAESLLTIVSDEASKQNGRPVAAKISCGTLNPINDEVLCFAFEAIAKGTLCQGLTLKIEHKPLQGHCKNCGQKFEVDFASPKCPHCSGEDFELMPDAPLLLEQIEFQTE